MDDSEDTLGEIAERHQRPIVSLLLEIQDYNQPQRKFMPFLKNLECFYIGRYRTNLRRTSINVFTTTNYVALSYTWDPSEHEDSESEGYSIQTRKRHTAWPSPVRNCVYDRITEYMRTYDVKHLWIDRHSIPQKTPCKNACKHTRCRRKREGLQCMDQVYARSDHPVALLGRPLRTRSELALLSKILEGGFVRQAERDRQEATNALKLLFAIVGDLWWQRAWTFQENYKGGENMVLLISDPHSLKEEKTKYGKIFGDVQGELCIMSRDFSEKATHFCQQFKEYTYLTPAEMEMIGLVETRAGRYTVLLDESQTMSPTIIADVERRDVKLAWDRLAIVGNCCSYPKRMDIGKLQRRGHSLSLSMLAMYLLNGEILDNNGSSSRRAAFDLTVSEFLKDRSLNKMSSPVEEPSLTFNKGIRFIDVELNETGILTSGYLWELGRIIKTADFKNQLPWVEPPKGDLDLSHHRLLTRLWQELEEFDDSRELAAWIERYLDRDANGERPFQIGENYLRMMMVEVSNAIENEQQLRLARRRGSDDYMAIFIWEGGKRAGSVFISYWPKGLDSEEHEANDTHRHVSLEVKVEGRRSRTGPPRLYTKGWVSGICVFVGEPREDVIFPWSPALKGIRPGSISE
ncbi:hypothetical protein SAMD00023353_2201000 [Rosellinia necatrix]|uniref:Heterokaryon incompatibility domain-containing protein n=1 Tax=Rosellinia necatrix TaxID=77044 RepID=A0A1S7UNZ1_ROSNE|nr:hypothetical protein SAMD00023353_2201000 [Rosellinia necatrix]